MNDELTELMKDWKLKWESEQIKANTHNAEQIRLLKEMIELLKKPEQDPPLLG